MGQVGQLRAGGEAGRGRVGVHHPYEAALLLLLLGFHVDLQVHGQHHLGGVALQHVGRLALRRFHMFSHQRLGFGSGDALGVFRLGQLGFHAANQAQHRAVGIGDDLHRAAGDGDAGIHLLEYIVAVAAGIGEGPPGLEAGAIVAAHQGDHGVHHLCGGIHVVHGAVRAGAVHKDHPPVPGHHPGRPAIQPVEVVEGQLDRRRQCLSQRSHRAQRQDQCQQHCQHALDLLHKAILLSFACRFRSYVLITRFCSGLFSPAYHSKRAVGRAGTSSPQPA